MSIAELKEREKEQRRAYIIDAAEKLFFAKGYDGVSMNDIAAVLELNKATLYLYFKNKDSLYFAVMIRGLGFMRDKFGGAVKDRRTGLDKLLATCRAFFEYCREHPEHYREMCYARTRSFDMGQVENASELMSIANEVIVPIEKYIEQGMADGTIRKGLDPVQTAVFVMTTCEKTANPGPEMSWVLSSSGLTPEQYKAYSMGLMLHAIAGNKADLKVVKW